MARIAAIASTVAKQLKLILPTNEDYAIGEDLTRFDGDPVGFIKYFEPDSELTVEQIDILISLEENAETNVQAGHGIGKTYLLGWAVFYFVFGKKSVVLCTAPTFRQVKLLLFRYIRSTYDKHKKIFGGRRTTVEMFLDNDSFASGFSTNNYDDNSFQGFHNENLLIVFDESNGISMQIDDGASSCLTGSDSNKIVRVGNPISSGTAFASACKSSHIRIPVWGHPNVSWAYELHPDGMHRLKPEIAEKILRSESDPQFRNNPVKPQKEWDISLPRDQFKGAVSVGWIEKTRSKKGEGSAYWQGRVEGLFPDVGGHAIVPQRWFLAARARYDINPEYWDLMNRNSSWSFGVDVGDGGDDHCIVGIQGNVVRIVDVIPTLGDRMDVITLAEIVAYKYLRVYPGSTAGVDRTGVGSGTLGWLLKNGYDAWGAAFGESAENKNDEDAKDEDGTFLNWKAEAYWGLREFLAARQDDDVSAIAPMVDEEYLMDDLNGTYYEETDRGTRMEDKKKTISRIGRSPNAGDALCIARAGMAKIDDIRWRAAYS